MLKKLYNFKPTPSSGFKHPPFWKLRHN